MAGAHIRLLFVEDFIDDAILIARRLRQYGLESDYEVVDDLAGLATVVETKQFDIVLCDFKVPGLGAHRVLEFIGANAPLLPVIVVSGSIGEEQAADLMRAGARDIVLKSNLGRLAPAIEREVAAMRVQARLQVRADQSERHFANLVEQSIQGIIIRADRKTLFVNDTMCGMFGYSTAEMFEIRSMLDLIHSDDRPRVAVHIGRQIRGDDPTQRFEAVGLRRDGSTFWIETMVSNVDWFGDAAVQIVAIDISERKSAERALADNERKFRETFEAAPVAMCWLSLDHRYIRTNRAFQTLFGYSAEELARIGPAETSHPEALAEARRLVQDLIDGKSDQVEMETRHLHKSGNVLWLWAKIAPIRDLQGSPDYLLVHLQDITARKNTEQQLFQAQKMEAIGNFAGGIAHDFNNMLVPIIGLSEMMKEDLSDDSPHHENLDLVLDAAHRARDLVKRILTFSRQDEGAVSVIDLAGCVNDSLSLLRSLVPSTVKIVVSISSDVGAVLADAAQLQSIILNLGSNAVAAIGNRTGELRIGLADFCADQEHAAQIPGLVSGRRYGKLSVADNGCGMEAVTVGKIFNPFFTTKPPGEGTGLGLSMVHGIVERYGGAIDVTSHPGIGTNFDIYLPLLNDDSGET